MTPCEPGDVVRLGDDLRMIFQGLEARRALLEPRVADLGRDRRLAEAMAADRMGVPVKVFHEIFRIDSEAGTLVCVKPLKSEVHHADARRQDQ